MIRFDKPLINYVIGDATHPIGDGLKIIPHVTNDANKWGAGFVLAISKRWSEPEAMYRSMSKRNMGNVQFVQVEDDIVVANMIAQYGVGTRPDGKPPISYGGVRIALIEVNQYARKNNATIHAPMFGSGLSGGNWNIIEQIIKDVISVPTTIYVLNKSHLPKLG